LFRCFNDCFLIHINEVVKHLTVSGERSVLWWTELPILSQKMWHRWLFPSQTADSSFLFNSSPEKPDRPTETDFTFRRFHRKSTSGGRIPPFTDVRHFISHSSLLTAKGLVHPEHDRFVSPIVRTTKPKRTERGKFEWAAVMETE
jgi:hypothetical protein